MNVSIGENVTVVEHTKDGVFYWDAEVTKVTDSYFETKHSRKKLTNNWDKYPLAYTPVITKHYSYDNILKANGND